MFGEYALYCAGRVVALICDDMLFVKPTEGGRKFIGTPHEAPPYKGAKPFYLITADLWEDSDWLSKLIRISADELPLPKPKKENKNAVGSRVRSSGKPPARLHCAIRAKHS